MPIHRILPKYSSKPGVWDSELVPFLDGLMDILTDPNTEEFIFKKPAQIGGSELVHSFLMWANDQSPGDALVVMADQGTSEYVCKDRFEQSYLASPKLSKLFKSSTLHSIKAIGQTIYFAWATSVNKLASKPIKYLVLDEVSKYRTNNLETKPVYNAIERTETYLDKKIMMISTPNVPGSEIDIFYNTAHVRYNHYIPCPHCGHYQVLRWTQKEYLDMKGGKKLSGQVHWEGGQNATPAQVAQAGYLCGECGVIWTTAEKNKAVREGVWHTNDKYDGTPSKIGAHINRLYSRFPGGRFSALVEEFIRKKKDGTVDAWKGFVNNVLAEEFLEIVDKPQSVNIIALKTKRKPQELPEDTIAVTCGVDNQKDHKYFVTLAFNKEFRATVVDYGILDDWEEVEKLEEITYNIEYKTAKIWKIAVDSGGTTIDGKSMTHETYKFVRDKERFYAIKGRDMDNSIIIQKKVLEQNITLYRVNTQALLDQFYWMLSKNEITFHADTGKDFITHILNFQKVKDSSGNFIWQRKGGRVDYVHCICYAIAAAHPQWDNGIVELRRLPLVQNVNRVKVQRERKRTGRIINPKF